ncbi:MAG: SPASM domain-containing protein [Candidatus Pacearchaeota archaeon]|jgi:radical SAM protein with 4Fe4S-binding SPASM domain
MGIKYIFKELKYYKRLDGSPKRMIYKYLFSKTPLAKLTNTKIYNFFYKKRMDKFTREHRPTILQIENTNACNARCIMCPHNLMKRKQKVMSFKNFKKVVDEAMVNYGSLRILTITGFGECLVDRGIVEKIKYVNEKYPQLKIDLFTNGALLKKEISDQILDLSIHKINFSINSTEKGYKDITGLDYQKVRENILYFCNRKKEMKKIYPLVNFSLMILKENKSEIDAFIAEWSPYGDSVMTYLPLEWTGNKKVETGEKPPFREKRWACIPLWQNIMVDVDGNIIMCCQDYESKIKFGNILKKPIKEIMNSPKFQAIREMHKKGNFSMDLCNTCDNWINSSLWWWVYN